MLILSVQQWKWYTTSCRSNSKSNKQSKVFLRNIILCLLFQYDTFPCKQPRRRPTQTGKVSSLQQTVLDKQSETIAEYTGTANKAQINIQASALTPRLIETGWRGTIAEQAKPQNQPNGVQCSRRAPLTTDCHCWTGRATKRISSFPRPGFTNTHAMLTS